MEAIPDVIHSAGRLILKSHAVGAIMYRLSLQREIIYNIGLYG